MVEIQKLVNKVKKRKSFWQSLFLKHTLLSVIEDEQKKLKTGNKTHPQETPKKKATKNKSFEGVPFIIKPCIEKRVTKVKKTANRRQQPNKTHPQCKPKKKETKNKSFGDGLKRCTKQSVRNMKETNQTASVSNDIPTNSDVSNIIQVIEDEHKSNLKKLMGQRLQYYFYENEQEEMYFNHFDRKVQREIACLAKLVPERYLYEYMKYLLVYFCKTNNHK